MESDSLLLVMFSPSCLKGCAAVTRSHARQLSLTQIGVGIKGACEAAVHAIRRHVMDHIESGQ